LTWGFGVAEGQTFAAQLEAALASKFPGRDIQVLNAGVPGYGTADELHFLESRAAVLEPDLVIVQFLPENDFIENRIPAQSGAEVRDGWLVAKSGTAEFSSFQPRWLRVKNWLKAHSHLASFMIERLGYLASRVGLLGHIAATRGEDFTQSDEQRAVELLRKLSVTAERLGAPSIFLFSTGQAAIISKTSPPMRAVAVVERAAREAKAGFIDLTPALRARPNRLKLYYTVDGHWTAEGHAAVAEIVTEYVVSENLLGVKSLAQ
jgi:lysophospholipase L1-like esterase